MSEPKPPAAQVAMAVKAAAMVAATQDKQSTVNDHVRLISKQELLEIIGVSFPTIWAWQRTGRFPRARVLGGKSCWLSTEIEDWIAGLPVRKLKGDDDVEAA